MSRVMRPIAVRSAVLGLALAGLGMCGITAARAGDLGPPMYGPPVSAPAPYPAPNYGAVYGGGGPCRIVLERHVDPYGREIVRRARVCEEAPMYPSVAGPVPPPEYGYPAPPPEYGYPAPRYYQPQPSGYYAYPPRPPTPVGPGYYN